MIVYFFWSGNTENVANAIKEQTDSYGGSGLPDTVNEIKVLEAGATVTDGLHIGISSASNPDNAVSECFSEIGIVNNKKG